MNFSGGDTKFKIKVGFVNIRYSCIILGVSCWEFRVSTFKRVSIYVNVSNTYMSSLLSSCSLFLFEKRIHCSILTYSSFVVNVCSCFGEDPSFHAYACIIFWLSLLEINLEKLSAWLKSFSMVPIFPKNNF